MPIVLAALQHLLKSGEKTSLVNQRTAACLSIQFFLTARQEEARRLLKSNVQLLHSGDLHFNFIYAKNNSDHENRSSILKSISDLGSLNPVFIVQHYLSKLNALSLEHPLLFPKFKCVFTKGVRFTVIDSSLEPFSYDNCAKAYKSVYQELHLDVDISTLTGTHAPRIGSATEAVKSSKVNLFDLKHSGRWVSDKTPLQYLCQSTDSLSKVSEVLGTRLLEEQRKQSGQLVDQVISEALDGFV